MALTSHEIFDTSLEYFSKLRKSGLEHMKDEERKREVWEKDSRGEKQELTSQIIYELTFVFPHKISFQLIWVLYSLITISGHEIVDNKIVDTR